jgi:eukaryotic-like serine/threonine-protein kinase
MQCPSCQTPVDGSQRFCPSCGTVLAPSDVEQQDPLLGQQLGGKYTVVRLLGEGGMGAVYEGEQVLGTTRRKVAVKTLHQHLSKDPKIQARFTREVGTLAALQHPNTIQVFDFGTTPDGILYIVMEFLQGKSLADTLEKEGAMLPDRAGNIIRQVCGSLEEAHASDIVHRDLKPDNIVLIERAGQKDFAKVLDFGIAKRSKEVDAQEQKLTQQGMVLGTPPYMSPEQFTGQPIDRRSDIYSLAIMAYEMLTGRLPFRANTAWEWATQHMTQPPIPIETLAEGMRAPEGMRGAIRKGLAKSPDERFQSVKEFGEAFLAQAPASVVTGPQSAVARPMTEVGPPLDVQAAFRSSPGFQPPAMTGAAPMAGPPGHGYTPAGGNVAFPTPMGIPQAPPPPVERSGGRGLIVILAVLGVASIGAIGFALKGSLGAQKPVKLDNADAVQAAPETVLSSAPADSLPAGAGTAALPPLASGVTRSQVHVPPHASASSAGSSAASATPSAASTVPAATVSAAQAPPYDGIECQRARLFQSQGHARLAEREKLKCIMKGGTP